MAYQLTLKDFENEGSQAPAAPQNSSQSFMPQFNPIPSLGQMGQNLQQGLSNLGNQGKAFLDTAANMTVVPAINWANKLGLTEQKAEPMQTGSGQSYDQAKGLANVLGYGALPFGGIPTAAGRIAAGAGLGAFESPESPLAGATLGAAGMGVGEAARNIPSIYQAGKSLITGPKEKIAALKNNYGAGLNPDENKELVYSLARQSRDRIENKVKENFNSIFSNPKVGEQPIYSVIEGKKAGLKPGLDFMGGEVYKNVEATPARFNTKESEFHKLINDTKLTGALKDQVKDFKQNPTFEKAHFLQSNLAKEGYQIDKRGPNADQRHDLLSLSKALQKDIDTHLSKSSNLETKASYDQAKEFYKNRFVPYLETKLFRGILNNDDSKVPASLRTLLNKIPSTKDTASGQILKDIGADEVVKRAIAESLGNPSTIKEIPRFLQGAQDLLKSKGISPHLSPARKSEFTQYLKDIEKNYKQQKVAKYLGLGAAGTAAGGLGIKKYIGGH